MLRRHGEPARTLPSLPIQLGQSKPQMQPRETVRPNTVKRCMDMLYPGNRSI